jgi:conserved oligomeric Golgi complex subunit 8
MIDVNRLDYLGSQHQRLESLLGQVMYFGASFSRYGFDFRPLFIQFFTQTALNNFRHAIIEADSVFEQLIQSYTFDQYVQIPSSDVSNPSTNPFVPPMILVSYTPLAIYCNALLSAFNDLRLCCPLAIVNIVKELLTNSLISIRDRLCRYYNAEKLTLTVVESEHFLNFLRVFVSIFIPYISTCLQALFSDQQLARELGVNVLDISEKSKLNRIELEKISEPIETIMNMLMPKKSALLDVITTDLATNTSETDKNTTVINEELVESSSTLE